MYEKELIELRRMLGDNLPENKLKEIEIMKELESEIINKSKFNMHKVSW